MYSFVRNLNNGHSLKDIYHFNPSPDIIMMSF